MPNTTTTAPHGNDVAARTAALAKQSRKTTAPDPFDDTTKLADDIERQTKAKPNGRRAANKEQEQLKAADADVKSAAQALHSQLVAAWKTFHDSLAGLSDLIVEAQEKEIYRYIVNPETKEPYENWQTYIMAVAARDMRGEAKLSAKDRNDLIELLIKAGVSIRGAAKAAGVSPSVAHKVSEGEKPGEPKPAQGDGKQQSGSRATRSGEPQNTPVAQAINAIDRAVKAAQRSPEASGYDPRINILAINNLRTTMRKAERELKKVVDARQAKTPKSGSQGTNPRKGSVAA